MRVLAHMRTDVCARNISPQFISVLSGIDSAHKLRLLIVAVRFCVVRRRTCRLLQHVCEFLVDALVGGPAVKLVMVCVRMHDRMNLAGWLACDIVFI